MNITKLFQRLRLWLLLVVAALLVAYYKDGIHSAAQGNRVLVGAEVF